jgi:hypothetical protein
LLPEELSHLSQLQVGKQKWEKDSLLGWVRSF